ncbi:T9SS type A sorting domain-containing protein [Winogradskyella sp.]|uniref:T9SS type A sorting domain-containing protein n=1 Tax=Winogradskyella sp. TaxID=1883156 RepID=UPI002614EFEB|nr:T9SS type A sorting domain-containing protein [Winogradskyella sp.]
MKKIVRNILVVAVMLGTYTSYANKATSDLPTSYEVKKGNYISISDAQGKVIFSGETSYNGNITEFFDFSQLKDGVYTVEVTNAFEIEINSVEVKNHSVTFIDNAKAKFFKPVFRAEDSKIFISKLALDAKEMKVELYFEDDLFHSETIKGGKILNRVYQLDRSLSGDYTAIIRTNDRVYVEHFRI